MLEERHFLSYTPTMLYGDNQVAVALAKNPVSSGRLRRLRLKEHAVREHIKHAENQTHYISTDQMIANTSTKALPKPRFEQQVLTLCVWSFPLLA